LSCFPRSSSRRAGFALGELAAQEEVADFRVRAFVAQFLRIALRDHRLGVGVEKDGVVTAIWEMKGRKHLRTIDPRSRQGREILNLYTTEDEGHAAASEAATS